MPLLAGCRKRLRAASEAIETAASPSLKRLRQENGGLAVRLELLEERLESTEKRCLKDAREVHALEGRVLALAVRDASEGRDVGHEEALLQEETRRLRERVQRAKAEKADKMNLRIRLEEEKTKAEMLQQENTELERRVEEHEAEKQALQAEKELFEKEKLAADRKLTDKTRRQMVLRQSFADKLRRERDENDKLQKLLSEKEAHLVDVLDQKEALSEGARRWQKWADAQAAVSSVPAAAATQQMPYGCHDQTAAIRVALEQAIGTTQDFQAPQVGSLSKGPFCAVPYVA